MPLFDEELQALNHEGQAKVDDLSRVNGDMPNLLDSTDVADAAVDIEDLDPETLSGHGLMQVG